MSTFLQHPPKTGYQLAKELLDRHRRMTVGDALQRGGPVADAIAELAFAARTDWTYEEAVERLEQLQQSTMPVGQWLGRHHSNSTGAAQ